MLVAVVLSCPTSNIETTRNLNPIFLARIGNPYKKQKKVRFRIMIPYSLVTPPNPSLNVSWGRPLPRPAPCEPPNLRNIRPGGPKSCPGLINKNSRKLQAPSFGDVQPLPVLALYDVMPILIFTVCVCVCVCFCVFYFFMRLF